MLSLKKDLTFDKTDFIPLINIKKEPILISRAVDYLLQPKLPKPKKRVQIVLPGLSPLEELTRRELELWTMYERARLGLEELEDGQFVLCGKVGTAERELMATEDSWSGYSPETRQRAHDRFEEMYDDLKFDIRYSVKLSNDIDYRATPQHTQYLHAAIKEFGESSQTMELARRALNKMSKLDPANYSYLDKEVDPIPRHGIRMLFSLIRDFQQEEGERIRAAHSKAPVQDGLDLVESQILDSPFANSKSQASEFNKFSAPIKPSHKPADHIIIDEVPEESQSKIIVPSQVVANMAGLSSIVPLPKVPTQVNKEQKHAGKPQTRYPAKKVTSRSPSASLPRKGASSRPTSTSISPSRLPRVATPTRSTPKIYAPHSLLTGGASPNPGPAKSKKTLWEARQEMKEKKRKEIPKTIRDIKLKEIPGISNKEFLKGLFL